MNEVENTGTSDSISTQVEKSALSISKLECRNKTEINVQNVKDEECQNEITHINQELRNQECDNIPQPTGATKRKTLVISNEEDEEMSTSTTSVVRPTPAQDAIKKEIDKLHAELDLTEMRKGSLVALWTELE